MDGNEIVHDSNRKTVKGTGTFFKVSENIKRIRESGISIGAIQTTTKKSLNYANEIVTEYVNQGLECIFIRPLTPLGYANEHWEEIGYTTEEFISFYRDALLKIIEYNKKGVKIVEAEVCPDHIHMLVKIPPKMSVAGYIGFLKGKSSLMIFQRHGNLKYKYGNRHFWCRGYFVDTVGRYETAIREYIQNQLQEDIANDQLSLKELADPFTGGKSREA